MKGDFTRSTFRREQHYSSVRMQQGRVQLDADWNEQNDITVQRLLTQAKDTIGASGGPIHDAGFAILASAGALSAEDAARPENQNPPAIVGADLLVSGGRYFVQGELAENERICLASDQPDAPKGMEIVRLSNATDLAFPPPAGTYLAYLDVWQRHVTALEDPLLREVALNGPDTATRARTVWQVKFLQVAALSTCASDLAEWNVLIAPSTGKLAARAEPDATSTNPCIVAPGAGYRRLENQLYRVEIHAAGTFDTASFKWSRDNGSVVVAVTGKSGNDLIVTSTGRDKALGFAPGQWVELIGDIQELSGQPGTLVQLVDVEGTTLTVDPTTAVPPAAGGSLDLVNFRNPKVRRWDGATGAQAVEPKAGDPPWIALEDGVQVQFSAGSYKTGDYWLIPARVATADVEWPKDGLGQPASQSPAGIRHKYARLAMVVSDGTTFTVADCRKLFPPLTELEDQSEWHKRHNRYLHGWGVVCGLKVTCDADRRFVQVSKGYALACDGTDILHKEPTRQNVVGLAQTKGLLAEGNGKIELTIDKLTGVQAPAFDVRAHAMPTDKSVLAQILEGTLAQDVIDDCITPVLDFLRKELSTEHADDTRLVGKAARKRISVLNLIVQLFNRTSGKNVFLSHAEHDLLAEFHQHLREFIAIKAFCGMFDDLPALPAYPFDQQNIRTAFGRKLQSQVRMRPDGAMFYAFGATGNTIQGFNAADGEAVVEMELPALPGLTLTARDVAFVGNRLVVLASGADGSAIYQFETQGHKPAAAPVPIPDLSITRLGSRASEPEMLFALVKGKGLVRFSPRDFGQGSFDQPFAPFNASGHLVMGSGSAEGFAVATVAAGETQSDTYSAIAVIPLAGATGGINTIPLRTPAGAAATGSDGIALVLPARARRAAVTRVVGGGILYAVVNPAQASGNKRLLAIRAGTDSAVAEIPLPTDGPVVVSASPGHEFLLAAMEENFQIARIDPATNQFDEALLFPAQMQPTGFAAAPEQRLLLVANKASQTVSMIPTNVLTARPGVSAAALAEYRQAMVNAFLALLSRLAQMVKDCICDHLLVACPECGEGDRVVLAVIDIEGNRVKAICALERKEVVTFPKFLYWLSAVPVIPLVVWAVEKFCCAHLPALADEFFNRPRNVVSANTIVTATNNFSVATLKVASQETLARASLAGNLLSKSLVRDALPAAEGTVRLRTADILRRSPQEVSAQLEASGVQVDRVASYDEALEGNTLERIGSVPLTVRQGEKITLFTDRNGQVAFFTRTREAAAPAVTTVTAPTLTGVAVAPLRAAASDADVAALREQVAALQGELAEMKQQLAALAKPATPRPKK